MIGWISMAAALFSLTLGLSLIRPQMSFLVEIILVLAIATVGTGVSAYGMTMAAIPVTAFHVDERFLWVKGVSLEYLADAPAIPYTESESAESNVG
jgi:hypothetical protein